MVSNLRISELDFYTIKENLKTFLRNQEEFTDYDFDGAGLSVLLDLLAYNTHYMGYYLNMVGNEAFLDSAQIRNSVLSLAKLTNYRPRSKTGAKAIVDITISPDNFASSVTIPKYTRFVSEAIDGINYVFCTTESLTVGIANSVFSFSNVTLTQGETANISFIVSGGTRKFTIPTANCDTSTITVTVQESTSNSTTKVYNLANDITELDANSEVYFVEENSNETYNLYFGDNVIGKSPANGNIVIIRYLETVGEAANKANNFINIDNISGYSGIAVNSKSAATGGSDKETIEEIRYRAPIHYTVQNRTVTKNDYGSQLLKDYPSIAAISVWGGEENDPPVYGKVYVSLRMKGDYVLSNLEKERIKQDLISNRNVVTVSPEIIDPNYNYLIIKGKVTYNPRLTTLSTGELRQLVQQAITDYKDLELNDFNKIFRKSKLQSRMEDAHPSITGSDFDVFLQSRITLSTTEIKNYELNYNTAIKNGSLSERIYTYPLIKMNDSLGTQREVFLEESALSFTGISKINIINPGRGYTYAPTITIVGDGTGATAEATVSNGRIVSVRMTNTGTSYTRASVTLNGGEGVEAQLTAQLQSRVGTLNASYYRSSGEKVTVRENVGTINYDTGIVTLTSFTNSGTVTNDLFGTNILTVNVPLDPDIVYPVKNRIITLDENDSSSILLDIVAEQ